MNSKKNRVFRYLFLSLRLYNNENKNSINYVDIPSELYLGGLVQLGVGDLLYDEDYRKDKLFVLLKLSKHYQKTISYISDTDLYLDDYIYDDKHHMLVLKLKPGIVDLFLNGEYDKLYTEEELDICFQKTIIKDGIEYENDTRRILEKNSSYKNLFVTYLNKEFNTNLNNSDIKDDVQYDIPPVLKEEIFNYEKTEKTKT